MPNFLYFHIYCWNTTPAKKLTQLNSTWVVTPPPHKHLSDELQIWGKARSRSYQGKIIARWKTTFDGRHPLMEDTLWWKTSFDGRQTLMENYLWWKTTFDGGSLHCWAHISVSILPLSKIGADLPLFSSIISGFPAEICTISAIFGPNLHHFCPIFGSNFAQQDLYQEVYFY